jgi:uncharacterized protein YbjT (DUF2867 family)
MLVCCPSSELVNKTTLPDFHYHIRLHTLESFEVMAPSILLIGASGSFGRPLVEEFITQLDKFDKVGVLADPSKLSKFAEVASRGIKVVPGAFDDPKAYNGYDTVISLAGNSIMGLQTVMIDAAISGGVTHFYPSEYGADLSQPALKDIRYFVDKHAVRNHLAAAAQAHPDFRYTLMLTGAFIEWTANEFYGVYPEKKEVIAYGTPAARIDATSIPEQVISILSDLHS